VQQLVVDEADAVTRYRSGKTEVLGYLIGQAMKKAGGKLNPNDVRAELMKVIRTS